MRQESTLGSMADLLAALLDRHPRTLIATLRSMAEALEAELDSRQASASIQFTDPQGVSHMANITVYDNAAPFQGAIKVLNAAGHEVEPDDVPVWASSDTEVATIAAAADGKTATVTVGSKLGASLITATTVEANTSETIVGTGTVTVIPEGTGRTVSIDFLQE